VPTHGVATDGTDAVVGTQFRARESLQDNTEASRSEIEVARLKPHSSRIRNPVAAIVHVDVAIKCSRLLRFGSRPSVKPLKTVIGICFPLSSL
jgi:hypothetical protein